MHGGYHHPGDEWVTAMGKEHAAHGLGCGLGCGLECGLGFATAICIVLPIGPIH
jgi:hypothetical protein